MGRPLSSYVSGEALPPLHLPPLTRHMLALYCGGSGDHNPLHTDIDFAREKGHLPDVIGHGMLSMALAGRLLTGLAPPEALRAFEVRFVGMTHIDEPLTVEAVVEERQAGRVKIGLTVAAPEGRLILTGKAVIELR
jgi:acyl dehydratase